MNAEDNDNKKKYDDTYIPLQPKNSFRIILNVTSSGQRLDNVLLTALRQQNENMDLKNITRTEYKELFNTGKITIKGQKAKPSSTLARGETYIDILKFN
jgi:hypothetical protein